LEGNKTIIANFVRDTFEITLLANPPEGGTVVGSSSRPCGTQISINTYENPCYQFTCWTNLAGDTISRQRNELVSLASDTVLIANFVTEPFTLTLVAEPTAGGTVNGLGIWTGEYNCRDTAFMTAIPNVGYEFLYWLEIPENSIFSFETNTFVEMLGNHTFHAIFQVAGMEVDSVNLVVIPNPTAGGTAVQTGRYPLGSYQRVTATSYAGYRFVNWTFDSPTGIQASSNRSFNILLNGDITLYANFVDTTGGDQIIVSLSYYPIDMNPAPILVGGGAYSKNATASILTNTPEGYSFVNWTNTKGEVVSYNFNFQIIVTKDTAFIANFTKETLLLIHTANPLPFGHITGTPAGFYSYKQPVKLSALSNDPTRFVFKNWTYDGEEFSTNPEIDFLLTSSIALAANFIDISGIDEYGNYFSIYPNPTNDKLNLKFSLANGNNNISIVNIGLYDLFGREIFEIFNGIAGSDTITKTIDVSKLTQGTYFVKILINGNLRVEKIVVY
jgi:hypothetical protein